MKSPLRLVPGTRYHNIVNIGCGWASGVNFPSSYDWPSLLQSILSVYARKHSDTFRQRARENEFPGVFGC